MQYFEFERHRLSHVFKGCWQLGGGHGVITRQQALADLDVYVEHGVNTFDMGDIYTGAEETMGMFLKRYADRFGKARASGLRMHTKFVPDLNALEDLTEKDIRSVIERSLKRLGLKSLHLVQFHWWDFSKGDFVAAAKTLDALRHEGLIETIGLTNFDCQHTQALLDADIPIRSNQIQFSLLDPRPFNGMLELAQKNDIAIFCYGVLAGGLLGSVNPAREEANRSHIKYGLVIEEQGETYYRHLLQRLDQMAKRYNTSVSNIATRFVLQTPGVSAAILGPRNTKHITELDLLFSFELSKEDFETLTRELKTSRKNNDDIYSYERDRDGRHGNIMKYNLNGMRAEQK